MTDEEVRDAKNALREPMNRLWEAFDLNRPELFHYTTEAACRSIIEKAELWCTDIRDVNDPREGDHGLAVIKQVANKKAIPKSWRGWLLGMPTLFGLKEEWHSYICCFCGVGEDTRMWHDYGRNEEGWAVVSTVARRWSFRPISDTTQYREVVKTGSW